MSVAHRAMTPNSAEDHKEMDESLQRINTEVRTMEVAVDIHWSGDNIYSCQCCVRFVNLHPNGAWAPFLSVCHGSQAHCTDKTRLTRLIISANVFIVFIITVCVCVRNDKKKASFVHPFIIPLQLSCSVALLLSVLACWNTYIRMGNSSWVFFQNLHPCYESKFATKES